ncbi:ABC transporter permease [Ruficoccus amylovorans]|uniref:ABC transporter permease n=1 Tax=Ruficoccus amylovorans TaxID=1804625 RepID=A0A842HBC7_9BACT|nr:ABC transporter permease [Ruficoccus amylovorans]MBC2593016.1 ABC transporter permease [Ruficoccus amylovorans]
MPWYLYLALKQLFPSGRFVSLFCVVSVIGVTLGVMVLLIVQSVMNGFGNEIRDKLSDTDGHVRIQGGGIIYQTWPLVEMAEQIEGVETVAPYAEGMVMMMHRNIPAFPYVLGVDVLGDEPIIPFDRYLRGDSRYEDLDDETVFLGAGLAASIGAYKGSTLEVYSPLMLEKLKRDEVLLPRELTVAGIFDTGYNKIDANTMIVTLRLMQELYGLGDGAHGVSLRLKDRNQADAVAKQLNDQLQPPYRAVTWLDRNSDILFVLSLEKAVMSFIILFIILVASFSIASSLFTAVVRKTREIGLIGAMGGRSRQMAAVFCFQGFIIGVVGSLLGVGLALLALHYRVQIVDTFARATNSADTLVRFYQFRVLPVHYEARDFILIITFAIIVSTVAGLLPAWRAARLKPADALRNE